MWTYSYSPLVMLTVNSSSFTVYIIIHSSSLRQCHTAQDQYSTGSSHIPVDLHTEEAQTPLMEPVEFNSQSLFPLCPAATWDPVI